MLIFPHATHTWHRMQVGYRLGHRSESGVTCPFESFQAGSIDQGRRPMESVREYFQAGSIAQGRRPLESLRCGQLGPCHLFCQRAHLLTGQNVGRWAIPSADGPIWLHFAQSADGMSGDGTSHLSTFFQSAYWTKCSQTGHPVCRQARLQMGQNVGRWAVPSADGTRRQMGWNNIITTETPKKEVRIRTVSPPISVVAVLCVLAAVWRSSGVTNVKSTSHHRQLSLHYSSLLSLFHSFM